MIRSLAFLPFVLAAGAAHANQFQLAPQITAIAPGEHGQELVLSLLPSPNTTGAEIDIKVNLDRFGWVQALPSPPTSGMSKQCAVIGGAVRAMVVSSTTFPTMYSIPVCRIRVRPHLATPRGNYYTSSANGIAVRLDGSSQAISANSARLIVDD
jgi:hypothetical protein